jgi:SAM-dependent methyltransferase
VRYFGRSRYCPLCRSSLSTFLPFGTPPRPQARCPVCWSLERHRLLWLFIGRFTDLLDKRPKRLLHFAPEAALESLLRRQRGIEYTSIDIRPGAAMLQMDITALDLPGHSFDVVLCSHVLEHIPDDAAALRELFRVTRPGGWALLMVPIRDQETTLEDASVTDPAQRAKLFGAADHVRYYGCRDFMHRLGAAGWAAEHYGADRVASAGERERTSVKNRDIFLCRRPALAGEEGAA